MNEVIHHRKIDHGRVLTTVHAHDGITEHLTPASTFRQDSLTPQTQDGFVEAIEDHYASAMDAGQDNPSGRLDLETARRWYLSMMPMLTSRRSVQLYIAIAAYGRQTNLLTQSEVKHCLYVAQLALAAFGTRNDSPEQRLRNVHAEVSD